MNKKLDFDDKIKLIYCLCLKNIYFFKIEVYNVDR